MDQSQTTQEAASARLLVSFTPTEKSKLMAQARVKGLRLATYVRSLVVQCLVQQAANDVPRRRQERAGGAGNR